ncbi:SDR family NAD(P)-dependent oxidoreductase, partial [Chloroflexota bacterium]
CFSTRLKIIIITYLPVGIGKEVALLMAMEGAKVVVNDIGTDSDGTRGADRVVNEIKEAKGTAVASYDSVVSMAGGESIIKTAISSFGRIDILVNTAGNFFMRPTVDYTEADWDAIMDVHLKGLFACTQAAIIEMIKQKSGGRIINISSEGAYLEPEMMKGGAAIAYATAKAGVLGFSRALSIEMQEHGITVNAISPHATTALFGGGGKAPVSPVGPGPEYVAPIIAYLATDEAKDITGQIFFSMGGEIRVFAPPMLKGGAHQHLYKKGKWTVDELIDIVPQLVEMF